MINLKLACYMDAPVVYDSAAFSIPGSGSLPRQVVASLPARIKRVIINETLGQHVGLYRGKPGFEQEICSISGGGTYEKPVDLSEGERISIRSLETNPITNGTLLLEFYSET